MYFCDVHCWYFYITVHMSMVEMYHKTVNATAGTRAY